MSEETRTLVLGGGTQGTVTRCRDFTRRALVDWRWLTGPVEAAGREDDADLREAAEDVLLIVSELVSNACVHAGGPHALALRRSAARLRIEVGDGSPQHPRRLGTEDPALPLGHGLVILERLARAWGWEPYADGRIGKTVWAEVPVPVGRPPLPPAPVTGLPGGSSAGRPGSG
ncbi:ATP-binding protein [Streptomyces sp. NPDC006430]|uniref:ATP-binding protein n=1 Tax=Streptomyces sp. NPDC006430 TaxID=3154299 RepID=UPI0033A2C0FF